MTVSDWPEEALEEIRERNRWLHDLVTAIGGHPDHGPVRGPDVEAACRAAIEHRAVAMTFDEMVKFRKSMQRDDDDGSS